MKATKIMKRVFTFGLILLLFTLLAACQEDQPETMLQPPIEGLSWGMTQEEVLEALHLKAEEVNSANSSGSAVNLNYAQAGLGADVKGIALTESRQTIQLYFEEYQGVQRLSTVAMYVYAESGPALKEALTAAYGEPYEGDWTIWSGTDLKKDAADADVEKLDQYDLGTALQITGGERKLFAVRPFVSVQYAEITASALPPLKSNQSGDFLLMYHADTYLLSLYGSEPIEETVMPLAEPVYGLFMGMSRADFAELIGSTEEELLATSKKRIEFDYIALGISEPEFLGFELCSDENGLPRKLQVSFDDEGKVMVLQVIVLADSKEDLENRLTHMYGEPEEGSQLQWRDPNDSPEAPNPWLSYFDNQAVIDGQCAFTLLINANM